jgi:lipopolysaccharide transport system permease protein
MSTSAVSEPPTPPAATIGTVQLVDDRPTPWRMLQETWAHRELLPRIGTRIIVKGTAGAKLGRSWLFLRPTLSIVGFSLLFGAVLDAPSEGVPYLLFLLVGMIGWMAFERFLWWSTRSFDSYRKFADNLDLPLLLIPTAGGCMAAIEVGVVSLLAVLATIYFGVVDGRLYLDLGPNLLLSVAGLSLSVTFAWGMGMWLSVLNLKARDVRIMLRYVNTIWLYVTPVIYSTEALDGIFSLLATLNPMTAPVLLFKQGMFGVGSVEPAALAISIAATVLTCLSGLWFLTRNAARYLREDRFVMEDDEEELL